MYPNQPKTFQNCIFCSSPRTLRILYYPPVLANIPPGFSPFHQLSADHAYGTAILLRHFLSKNASLSSFLPPNHMHHLSHMLGPFQLLLCKPSMYFTCKGTVFGVANSFLVVPPV
ncbi:hypothetical protein DAPPUDRAFT_256553 [Daphnia pulex]|uniref:Uncharacterized protein n=1 Tax=Daphnia pulex TaxID=6669 RepID=E9HBM0_DAPPU|nr:hypothetical protein DAPPUDRAFT_256553 [Daphnia pulex]|eukprot:EFX70869.1 hypothetical protein DAPPUDRAFT_256553 [Daphnia pulex]